MFETQRSEILAVLLLVLMSLMFAQTNSTTVLEPAVDLQHEVAQALGEKRAMLEVTPEGFVFDGTSYALEEMNELIVVLDENGITAAMLHSENSLIHNLSILNRELHNVGIELKH